MTKTSQWIGDCTVDMKTYENFTVTVKQLIEELGSIANENPNKTLSFNHHGTTLYIDGIRSMEEQYDTVILESWPAKIGAFSVEKLLDKLKELNGVEETTKVLLQGDWMLYDLKRFEDDRIFHYSDTGELLFEWEDCDVRLLTAQQLINDLKSLSEKAPDRKVAYSYFDINVPREKLQYLGKLGYVKEYGIYVLKVCDATNCATADSLLKDLSANPGYASKGVVVYHNQRYYKTIKFDSAGIFFEGKDGDDDIINFRIGKTVRGEYLESTNSFELSKWCYYTPYQEFVDLGLSVNWATHNIGAKIPREYYGFFYSWGEVWPKDFTIIKGGLPLGKYRPCTKENYKFYHNDHFTKYCSGKYTLDACDDAAHYMLGEGWRLPTKEEFEELINKCRWEWNDETYPSGYKVTGPNGNSIFLPAAGLCIDGPFCAGNDFRGVEASYWSASGEDEEVYVLNFTSRLKRVIGEFRHYGIPIRAVCPKIS